MELFFETPQPASGGAPALGRTLMNNINVVWTAVATVALAVASALAAWQGSLNFTIAFGLGAIASATLASREQ
jgi:hypothetical protein